MDTIEAIKARRSVRAYEARAVEAEKLETLLECARIAPSANNLQQWHFTLITDDALLRSFEDEFSAQAPEMGAQWRERIESGYKVLHSAPAAILISAAEARDINAGIAAENICLAAQSLGLGSCIIGLIRVVFNGPNGHDWARKMACPADLHPALMVTVGYPAASEPAPRRLKSELISRI